jgi:hypothetical protein
MKIGKTLILAVAFIAVSAMGALQCQAEEHGRHPAYLHALSNLRAMRAYWLVRFGLSLSPALCGMIPALCGMIKDTGSCSIPCRVPAANASLGAEDAQAMRDISFA